MKRFSVTVNGVSYDVQVQEMGAGAPAPVYAPAPAPVYAPAPAPAPVAAAPAPAPAPAAAPAPAPAAAPAGGGAGEDVTSPMPGNIWEVKCTVGQQVKLGDVLIVLEAMKMENDIVAHCDGTVSAIHVAKGDAVDTGSVLVTI